jgi:hypothetical protein
MITFSSKDSILSLILTSLALRSCMKNIGLNVIFLCLFSFDIQSLECELQLQNECVNVYRIKITPHEEIDLHRDAYPQVVVALQGGVITRLEANGETSDIHFPAGQAVFRPQDPLDQLHKSVNNSADVIELIAIQLKKIE